MRIDRNNLKDRLAVTHFVFFLMTILFEVCYVRDKGNVLSLIEVAVMVFASVCSAYFVSTAFFIKRKK